MNKLARLYYDSKTGYVGANKLYQKALENGIKVDRVQVDEFIREQPVAQKLTKRGVLTTKIPIQGPVGSYQMDLAFIPQYKSTNNGYDILLTCVGINNRRAYVVPLKSKTSVAVVSGLKKLISEVRRDGPLVMVESDNGSEFISRPVQKLLREEGITHTLAPVESHNQLGIIERFNRTLKGYLSKWFIANNTTRWLDVLPELVYNYNHTVHSAIKTKPASVDTKGEEAIFLGKLAATDFGAPELRVGDTVRVAVKRGKFSKEGQVFSDDTYVVTKVNTKTAVLDNGERVKIGSLLVVPAQTNTRVTRQTAAKLEEKKKVENAHRARRMYNRLMA